jgi:hypothetical protein
MNEIQKFNLPELAKREPKFSSDKVQRIYEKFCNQPLEQTEIAFLFGIIESQDRTIESYRKMQMDLLCLNLKLKE